jgi:hypothetical protein
VEEEQKHTAARKPGPLLIIQHSLEESIPQIQEFEINCKKPVQNLAKNTAKTGKPCQYLPYHVSVKNTELHKEEKFK